MFLLCVFLKMWCYALSLSHTLPLVLHLPLWPVFLSPSVSISVFIPAVFLPYTFSDCAVISPTWCVCVCVCVCVYRIHRFSDNSIRTDNCLLGHDIKQLPGEDMWSRKEREKNRYRIILNFMKFHAGIQNKMHPKNYQNTSGIHRLPQIQTHSHTQR